MSRGLRVFRSRKRVCWLSPQLPEQTTSGPCDAEPSRAVRIFSGLTVTEALWKGKPTIAGAVGGIPNQIIHKLTGVLVHSVEGCAFQIRYLLTHPEFARTIGANGREHVKENFLMTTNVKRWLLLFRLLEQAKARLPKAA